MSVNRGPWSGDLTARAITGSGDNSRDLTRRISHPFNTKDLTRRKSILNKNSYKNFRPII